MISTYRILVVIGVSALLAVALVYWAETQNREPELQADAETTFAGPLTQQEQTVIQPANINDMNPTAIITTNHGTISLELFEDQMPVTVGNFITLAESDFYDGTKFHRVIPGFMIQGGDPNTRGNNESIYGTGGPEENVSDEFVEGELLTNTRGTIAMANTGQPNSGGSQFFINLTDNSRLDFDKPPFTSKHPVFGRVIEGMDVIDAIANVETKAGDIPEDPVVVTSVEIVRQ